MSLQNSHQRLALVRRARERGWSEETLYAVIEAFWKGAEAGRDDFLERLRQIDPAAAARFTNEVLPIK